MIILKFGYGVHFVNTPLPLVTVFLIMIGVQFVLMGLIAEMLTRDYHEGQDKPTFRIAETIRP